MDPARGEVDFSHGGAADRALPARSPIHHARTVHGSATNSSGRPRRLLLHQYRAADAWPTARRARLRRVSRPAAVRRGDDRAAPDGGAGPAAAAAGRRIRARSTRTSAAGAAASSRPRASWRPRCKVTGCEASRRHRPDQNQGGRRADDDQVATALRPWPRRAVLALAVNAAAAEQVWKVQTSMTAGESFYTNIEQHWLPQARRDDRRRAQDRADPGRLRRALQRDHGCDRPGHPAGRHHRRPSTSPAAARRSRCWAT